MLRYMLVAAEEDTTMVELPELVALAVAAMALVAMKLLAAVRLILAVEQVVKAHGLPPQWAAALAS